MSTLELKELSHPAGEVLKIAAGKTLDLKSQGSVTMPTGSVLQVVYGSTSTEVTIATTTYTDTTLTATITPTSTSSKILVLWNQEVSLDTTYSGIGIKLLRDSTALYTSATAYDVFCGIALEMRIRPDWKYLDSPNTTSAIVYKTQVTSHSSRSIGLQSATNESQIVLMEIQG